MNAAALAPVPGLVRCSSCGSMLGGPWVSFGESTVRCQRCASTLAITTFPALQSAADPALRAGEQALEGEATCFFHPEKRAEVACERCGRFLCSLCDLPVGSRHLCPTCLAQPAGKENPVLITQRVSWPQVALLTALFPVIPPFFMFFMATGPVAVFMALYSWRAPGSLVHGKRRITAILALLIGLAECAGLAYLIYDIWKGSTHRVH